MGAQLPAVTLFILLAAAARARIVAADLLADMDRLGLPARASGGGPARDSTEAQECLTRQTRLTRPRK